MERNRPRRDMYGSVLFKEAQIQYLRVLNQQDMYWKQRAKLFWLKEGDQNTMFFHNAVRRRKQKNNIERLKSKEGNWVEKGTELDSLMVNYFSELFTSVQGDTTPIIDCILSTVTEAQNNGMIRRVSMEEVKTALFDMKPDKSPGPDGMTPGFY